MITNSSDTGQISTAETNQILADIKSRLEYGAIPKIAKKVKKSDDYIRSFLNGEYDVTTATSIKILDAIIAHLKSVQDNGGIAKHKMNTIVTEFPVVKPKEA